VDVQAEISIYPLRVLSLSEPIEEFCLILRDHDLEIKTTSMSTFTRGQSEELFEACRKAFEQLTRKYEIVMQIKISNACPAEKPNEPVRNPKR
jgi:uncharacterized protein YqgV (UPF0045/DUF77 family)